MWCTVCSVYLHYSLQCVDIHLRKATRTIIIIHIAFKLWNAFQKWISSFRWWFLWCGTKYKIYTSSLWCLRGAKLMFDIYVIMYRWGRLCYIWFKQQQQKSTRQKPINFSLNFFFIFSFEAFRKFFFCPEIII